MKKIATIEIFKVDNGYVVKSEVLPTDYDPMCQREGGYELFCDSMTTVGIVIQKRIQGSADEYVGATVDRINEHLSGHEMDVASYWGPVSDPGISESIALQESIHARSRAHFEEMLRPETKRRRWTPPKSPPEWPLEMEPTPIVSDLEQQTPEFKDEFAKASELRDAKQAYYAAVSAADTAQQRYHEAAKAAGFNNAKGSE